MKTAAVLFFGGERVSLTVARAGVNGTHIVKNRSTRPYSGIVGGEFVNNEELTAVLHALVEEVFGRKKRRSPIELTIGVPPCFLGVDVSTAEKTFDKPKKITQRDILDLLRGGRAVYYKIDGGNALIDAVGFTATRTLQAQVSKLTISDRFARQVATALVGIRGVVPRKLIPSVQAEAVYLIDSHVRDKTCVLISSGMMTTSVAVVAGDELCALETFDMGSAHAINDVSIVMSVAYGKAREMVNMPNNIRIAAILEARFEDMAEQVADILKCMDKNLMKKPFYICGGHVDAMMGARKLFERALNVKITPLVCPFTESNVPDEVSRDAVITMALKVGAR